MKSKKPYICAVISLKGGVGKTAVTMGVSGAMNQYVNKSVLVVDADPSINATNYFRQMVLSAESFDNTVMDCLSDNVSVENCIRTFTCYRTKGVAEGEKEHFFTETLERSENNTFTRTRSSTISLLPGDKSIDDLQLEDPMALNKKLHDNCLDSYDYIFIDCPPEIMSTTVQAMFAADSVLIVVEPGSDSIEGLADIMNNIREIHNLGHDLKVVGILMNKYAGNEWASQYFLNGLRENVGDLAFSVVIPRSSTSEKSRCTGVLPTVFERFSPYSQAFTGLAFELDGRRQNHGINQ